MNWPRRRNWMPPWSRIGSCTRTRWAQPPRRPGHNPKAHSCQRTDGAGYYFEYARSIELSRPAAEELPARAVTALRAAQLSVRTTSFGGDDGGASGASTAAPGQAAQYNVIAAGWGIARATVRTRPATGQVRVQACTYCLPGSAAERSTRWYSPTTPSTRYAQLITVPNTFSRNTHGALGKACLDHTHRAHAAEDFLASGLLVPPAPLQQVDVLSSPGKADRDHFPSFLCASGTMPDECVRKSPQHAVEGTHHGRRETVCVMRVHPFASLSAVLAWRCLWWPAALRRARPIRRPNRRLKNPLRTRLEHPLTHQNLNPPPKTARKPPPRTAPRPPLP